MDYSSYTFFVVCFSCSLEASPVLSRSWLCGVSYVKAKDTGGLVMHFPPVVVCDVFLNVLIVGGCWEPDGFFGVKFHP